MDAPNHHRDREKELKEGNTTAAAVTAPPHSHHRSLLPPPPPPSSVTSPSHEFSFTITLHPPPLSTPSPVESLKSCSNRKTTATTSSFVDIDLAPADDIFYHGQLLPLHPVARTTIIPPRDSDISMESFSLPLEHVGSDRRLMYPADDDHLQHQYRNHEARSEIKESSKAKTLSSFFGLVKLRKGSDGGVKDHDERKKKKTFDMSRFLKKYASMMETLFFFKAGQEKQKHDLRRRPYSFSGHSNRARSEKDVRLRKAKSQFSAPASLKTSPTNSGLLLARPMAFSSSDNSTMEELQSAIQAAIAHCKNSTARKEEKCK